MGITKQQGERFYVIDSELCKKPFVKTADLKVLIDKTLDISVTQKTIQNDLKLMQLDPPRGFSAPIEKNAKHKAYYYSDKNFTIQNFGLKQEDVQALLFYERTLYQLKSIKLFEDVLKAIEKIVDRIIIGKEIKKMIADRTLLQTEKAPIIKGHEFIEPIIKAIVENQKIIFTYSKFDGADPKRRELSPLLLKEDKHFWYVLGLLDNNDALTTFALDRMSDLYVTNSYFTPPPFDTEKYFKYSMGITVPEGDPVNIVLSFEPLQGKYLKALPIHETQKIIKDNSKEFRILIRIKPTYEFYSKILSYGNYVKVISPSRIKAEIKKRLYAAVKLYK
ncbi:MAG: WYL domain-containing protein [Ignavibacteriaceae bacterium]|nr:WYL domain-containing protein [Ignavibacteriaceae bacterium]